MIPANFIWTLVAFMLTLLVLTYLVIGDNPIFRAATYAFIGIGAAYIVLVTFNQVIWPKFFLVLLMPGSSVNEKVLLIVPLILSLMLLAKISPRLAGIGNPAMAYLVGVGAAVIIGGSVLGTVFPQTIAGINLFDVGAAQARGSDLGLTVLEGLIALVGTAATLLFFHFGAPSRPSFAVERGQIVGTAAQVGQVFLAVTLGAVFAGVYIAALTALVERAYFVLQFIF